MIFAIFVSTLIPLASGFYQAITGTGNGEISGLNRIYATAFYPNVYAFYLMIILIFICTAYFYFNSYISRAFLLLLSLFVSFSLILTYSRAGWSSTVFGLGVFVLIIMRKINRRTTAHLIILLLTFSILISMSAPKIASRFLGITGFDISTVGFRIGIWVEFLKRFIDSPLLGYGIGSSYIVSPEIILDFSSFPHSVYIKILSETGICGFIAYFAFVISLLKHSLKEYTHNIGTRKIFLASGMITLTLSFLLFSITEDLIIYDTVFSYFWFFAAVVHNLLALG
jgi:O-antigen ligase